MASILKESHSFTCTPRIHRLTEWTIIAIAFPAKAGIQILRRGESNDLSWPTAVHALHCSQHTILDTVSVHEHSLASHLTRN